MEKTGFKYPETRRDETIIDKHGLQDPYRWLEDPDSEETVKWVEAQNKVTFDYINSCAFKDDIRKSLTALYNYPQIMWVVNRGSRIFTKMNEGMKNQAVYYVQDGIDGKREVLLDPNTLSTDGTIAAVSTSFSESGKLMAYALSRSGSDWQTIHFRNVDTKEDLPDKLEWVKFSALEWTKDEKGLIYSRYPKPKDIDSMESNKAGAETDKLAYMKIYYHRIGTSQDEDILIYEDPENPEWFFGGSISSDSKHVVVNISKGSVSYENNYVVDISKLLDEKKTSIVKLIDGFDNRYSYITDKDGWYYFKTAKDAPNYKIIAIDINNPDPSNWKTIVPERDEPIEGVDCVDEDKFVILYSRHAYHAMLLYNFEGKFLGEIPIPKYGNVTFGAHRSNSDFFLVYESLNRPPTAYHYSLKDNKITPFIEPKFDIINLDDFEVNQVFYESKDGTKVPMFLVYKKGLKLDGTAPCLLEAYGGFLINNTPVFAPSYLYPASHMNGVFAMANIRGGAEYGEEWHKAALKENRQKCFDDFIAAAEYLIKNNYTCKEKLITIGGSNGGLLVAACANQRPDLFGCVLSLVGVHDLLRFHLFTVGYAWKDEYGDPDIPEEAEFLKRHSPLHNVRKGKEYPAMLLTTADHDDRVVPLHSYKLIATLQYTLGNEPYQKNPLMIRIDTKAGHGGGKPLSKRIEEAVDRFAFACNALNIRLSI